MALLNTLQVLNRLKNYPRWLFEQYAGRLRGHVIDVGSGIGDLVQYYDMSRVDSVTATDCSDEMLRILKDRFRMEPRYSVQKFDVADPAYIQRLGMVGFDVVICVNVLEHVRDDRAALRNMCQLLRPGGALCLIVPAFAWLHGTMDDLVGHERRYSRRTLLPLLKEAGFENVSFSYMNMFGVITWFVAFRVMRRKAFPVKTCETLDRMVPFLKALDRLFGPCFGQSLVVMARRPV